MSVALVRADREIAWRWLGRISFDDALALQEEIAADHASYGDTILLLEHPPVYTTGRRGKEENLPGQPSDVPLRRIGRGGDVTYHGPGQLVGYVLVDLRARGGDVHRFLRSLEAGVIALLGDLGVKACRVPGRTGVWVEPADGPQGAAGRAGSGREPCKIASIGIGVRRGISMHGFAINVSVDLKPFEPIVPCDLAGVRMTSVERETGRLAPALETIAPMAAEWVARVLPPRHAEGPS